MRRTLRALCSKIDLDGKPSAYYPRFRPRRLVMPVDPSNVHSSARQGNAMYQRHVSQTRLRRAAGRRGATKLAEVPSERSVGDAFRVMLATCEGSAYFDASKNFTSGEMRTLEALVQSWRRMQPVECSDVPSQSHSSASAPLPPTFTHSNADKAMSVRSVDRMWDLLDRTPLNSPVHGMLALRGKALVESTITQTAYSAFPRLRSKHIQQLLHSSCGLLPSSRVAIRTGFAEVAGVEGEIGMWRELNVLTHRLEVARRKAATHLERVEKGVTTQRRWYWRGVLRAAAGRLKMFPVHSSDIQPRLEWIRQSVFAFVAFLEMAEGSGEVGVCVRPFILKMFCSQLGAFVHRKYILECAEGIVALDAKQNEARWTAEQQQCHAAIRNALCSAVSKTPDEVEVIEGLTHPLNSRADRRREQFESSGGSHATQSLRDDIFEAYEVPRHAQEAPPIIIHALQTGNALKEAQLIQRYAPGVPAAIRSAPIDVDQAVRKVVEVHETNNYASLHNTQQYRQVEYTVCRLYCGKACVGEGKGETLMEAMQSAAQHMVLNYYLRADSSQSEPAADAPSEPMNASFDPMAEVRIKKARCEEEIIF